jgi:two-component system, NtrC family, response regulator PilR
VQPPRMIEKGQQQPLGDITALIVHDHGEHLARFEESLRLRDVELTHARNCQEASRALQQSPLPLLILTDTMLSDGTFHDILELAAEAEQFVNVLVVSEIGNITLYLEAMEHGAFDFLTPNIEPARFPAIVLSAAADAMHKRSAGSDGNVAAVLRSTDNRPRDRM